MSPSSPKGQTSTWSPPNVHTSTHHHHLLEGKIHQSTVLWGHLLEGVFSSQTYSSLNHVALSVPMSGAGKLRNVQCQKPHEERFL